MRVVRPVSFALTSELDATEWRSIELFQRRADEYMEVLNGLNLGIIDASFSRGPDGTYTGSVDLPAPNDLKALLLAFRHFYHDREPCFFPRVVSIVSQHCQHPAVRAFLRDIREQWKRSKFVESGYFRKEGRRLGAAEVLDLWFNAEIFHSDPEKEAALTDLNQVLSVPVSRGLLFLAVYDSGLCVRSLRITLEGTDRQTGTVRVPHQYVEDPRRLERGWSKIEESEDGDA